MKRGKKLVLLCVVKITDLVFHGTSSYLTYYLALHDYLLFFLLILIVLASRYTPLDSCLPYLPAVSSGEEKDWPISWPERLYVGPSSLPLEVERRYAEEIFYNDTKYWDSLVSAIYLHNLSINWSSIRNVMDMNAGYGG